MRIRITVALLLALSTVCSAQKRPNVDTLTLDGLKTGIASDTYAQLSGFDTIFWNADLGGGMLRKADDGFGHKGEYRVAIEDGKVAQVTFAIGAHNKTEANTFYQGIYTMLTDKYGNPDANATTEFRWEGVEQFYAVRLSDDGSGVNIVLSKFDHH